MVAWLRTALICGVILYLSTQGESRHSYPTLRQYGVTPQEVEDAILEGELSVLDLQEKQQRYREKGIDGRKNRPADRLARMLRRRGNMGVVADLARLLMVATRRLSRETGRSVDELRRDSTVLAVWREKLKEIFDIKNRRKRQSGTRDGGGRNRDGGGGGGGGSVLDVCNPTIDCSNVSPRFRTIDGTCNNADNPFWGAALTREPRMMDPVYADGVNSPRRSVVNDEELPSPRQISNQVFRFTGTDQTPEEGFNTLMSFNWGQFLDHDFVLTPLSVGDNDASITCCNETSGEPIDREECLGIDIPGNDPFYTTTCMEFTRSSPYVNEGCVPGPKQTMNEITSFIDASNVYGSNREEANRLRDAADRGIMDYQEPKANVEMLPAADDDACVRSDDSYKCAMAGDIRVNTQPGLGLCHLAFMREHNRIARELRNVRPGWGDNRVFNEARKIVGALMQQITYGEYMHNVLNDDTRAFYGLDIDLESTTFANVYDSSVDPSIRNAFAAAAFRFGHSQVPAEIALLLSDFSQQTNLTAMRDALLDPRLLVSEDGDRVTDLTRFMIFFPARRVDRFFDDSIRNTLFGGLDLTALNIQRGRDHGLPPYVEWRRECGLSVPTTFAELVNHTDGAINRLQQAYSDVRDIDLYVGGMTETRLSRSYVGPTFACIIGRQFQALKQGDAFWYENEGPKGFTIEQLNEIRKVRMSKILCNNMGLSVSQLNVFRQADLPPSNTVLPCSEIPDMSFAPWA